MGVLEELAKIDEELGVEPEKPEEDGDEELVAPEPTKEPEKPVEEVKAVETPRPANDDNQSWAAFRKRETERKDREELDRLRAENAELKAPKVVTPSKDEDFAGYVEHKVETADDRLTRLENERAEEKREAKEKEQYQGALNELGGFEIEHAKKVPETSEALNHLKGMISTSIYLLNPGIDAATLTRKTTDEYLRRGVQAFKDGRNPAEALVEQAVQLGYKKAPAQQTIVNEQRQPTLAKVAENKKKSSGMPAGASSGEGGALTDATLETMTNAERSRLTESDWARLESAG